jgi:hypothetical protein
MEEDFKYSREGRRTNLYLIRCPFPFTRVTRSALQSEGYGHPDGHLISGLSREAPRITNQSAVRPGVACSHLSGSTLRIHSATKSS